MLRNFSIIVLIVGFLYSCDDEKPTVDEILSKSLIAHGGLESWQKMQSLSFDKKTVLYTKDGSFEKEILQKQSFFFGGEPHEIIHSLTDSVTYFLKNNVYTKKNRDSVFVLGNEELTIVKNMFASAYYVVSQPFHMKESNALLTFEKDTLINSKKVFVVGVSYQNDDSESDQWTYYFDAETYRIVSCKVKHEPTVSYIENTEFDSSTPFLFNAKRKSTFLNQKGEKDYLRADYFYTNFKVKLSGQ